MIKLNEVLVEDFNTILKYGLKLIKQEQVQMPDMTILQLQLVIECVRGGGGTVPESTQSVTEYDKLTSEDIDVLSERGRIFLYFSILKSKTLNCS